MDEITAYQTPGSLIAGNEQGAAVELCGLFMMSRAACQQVVWALCGISILVSRHGPQGWWAEGFELKIVGPTTRSQISP